jgi:hypothetical protein
MAQDTLENESLIQEMLSKAQPAEMGIKDPIVSRGTDVDAPVPMVARQVSSSGYFWIWDTRTYEKIPVLSYLLQKKLRQRREDGSYRFTTIDPGKQPKRGSIRCMLHSQGDNRKHYDDMGFPVCDKENIINAYELRRHMQLKHKQVWAAIQAEEEEKKREEDRALQRLLLQTAAGRTIQPVEEEKPPLYISDKDKKKK